MADEKATVEIRIQERGGLRTLVPCGARVGSCQGRWDSPAILGDDSLRTAMRDIVEGGEVPLLIDPSQDAALDIPLCFIDFLMIEESGRVRVEVKADSWKDACRLVGFYATLCGVGRGLESKLLADHFAQWQSIPRRAIPGLILR